MIVYQIILYVTNCMNKPLQWVAKYIMFPPQAAIGGVCKMLNYSSKIQLSASLHRF